MVDIGLAFRLYQKLSPMTPRIESAAKFAQKIENDPEVKAAIATIEKYLGDPEAKDAIQTIIDVLGALKQAQQVQEPPLPPS